MSFFPQQKVLDPRTKLMLYKMVNNGTLESVSGSISTGKESVVFHAYGGRSVTNTIIITIFSHIKLFFVKCTCAFNVCFSKCLLYLRNLTYFK